MSPIDPVPPRRALVLAPGDGRVYPMGRISAIFKADGMETDSRYSISEWWLEPHTKGPGAHSHPEDDIFYVLGGTMSILVAGEWTHATKGSFVLSPVGSHMTSKTAGTRAPGCSISPSRARSSSICQTSRGGSPKIHRGMRVPESAVSQTCRFMSGVCNHTQGEAEFGENGRNGGEDSSHVTRLIRRGAQCRPEQRLVPVANYAFKSKANHGASVCVTASPASKGPACLCGVG